MDLFVMAGITLEACERPISDIGLEVEPVTPQEAGKVQVPECTSATRPGTFVAALRQLSATQNLTEAEHRRWLSDVSRVAKRCGCPPEELPTDPLTLVPKLERVPVRPAHRKSWANMRSSLRAVARRAGVLPERSAPALLSAWSSLLEPMWDQASRHPIMPFARWCSGEGLEPSQINAATLRAYREHRRHTSYRLDLAQAIASIAGFWHGQMNRQPGWPSVHLVESLRPAPAKLDLSAFSPTFRADLDRYLEFLRGAKGPFEGRARALAPATILLHREILLSAATCWVQEKGPIENLTSLAQLVTAQAVRAALLRRFDVESGWKPSAPTAASILISLAEDFVKVDQPELETLKALRKRIRMPDSSRLSEGVRRKLTPFDDHRLRRELYRLPRELATEADAMRKDRPFQAACLHRQAVMLGILLESAMRRRDLFGLRLDRDFMQSPTGEPIGIDLRAAKNHVRVETKFSAGLRKLLQRHLAIHRPQLPGPESPWLIPNPDGSAHASVDGQSARISSLVSKRLGIPFSLQMIRHLTASILFESHPENAVVAQRKLGHTELKTTTRLYGEFSTRSAHEVWAGIVDELATRQKPAKRQVRR